MNLCRPASKKPDWLWGSPYRSVVLKVLLPSASEAFLRYPAGCVQSYRRTAPLMLTALGATTIQWDITKPASAVSLLIWEFYNDPNLQA